MNPSATGKSLLERYTGQEPNTIKRIVNNQQQFTSDNQEVELNNGDFKSGQDSAIMVQQRARGAKLEGLYKKRKGVLLENSSHTITFLPGERTQTTVIPKRANGWNTADNMPFYSKWNNTENKARPLTSEEENTTTNECEATTPLLDALESKMKNQSDLATTIELANQSSSPDRTQQLTESN